ncbi:hypothetical protein M405DRAFT_820180, partial [Rhizopogon salebrosus TDB-379]
MIILSTLVLRSSPRRTPGLVDSTNDLLTLPTTDEVVDLAQKPGIVDHAQPTCGRNLFEWLTLDGAC